MEESDLILGMSDSRMWAYAVDAVSSWELCATHLCVHVHVCMCMCVCVRMCVLVIQSRPES